MYLGKSLQVALSSSDKQSVIDEANKYIQENDGWMLWRDVYITPKWMGWLKWKKEYTIELYKPIDYKIVRTNLIVPDDIQAHDAVMKLRKELREKNQDDDIVNINSWIMGVNWCKDFIKDNNR